MHHLPDQPLDYLDLIPNDIYRRLVTHKYRASTALSSQHSLQQRCIGILDVRQHLLDAQIISLRTLQNWLDDNEANELQRILSDQSLLAKTENNNSYTDDLINHILDWLDTPETVMENTEQPENDSEQDASSAASKHQDTEGQGKKDQDSESAQSPSPLSNPPDSADEQQSSISPTHQPTETRLSDVTSKGADQLYQSMQVLNKSFALERQLGWDLSKGIESETDIKLLLKYHRIIKNSSHLQAILQLVGRKKERRLDEVPEWGMNQETIKGLSKNRHLPDDHLVNSVTGIYKGDDIAKLAPAELMLLGHPKLKMLWHARRAEKQLLNYHFQGVSSDSVPNIQASSLSLDSTGKHAVAQQGPLLLCIDTSASMRGKPEQRAKAVALEAMRVAHLQRRDCYLYSFSGEGEIAEYALDLLLSGWQPVINFLKFSFYGGTDINQVLSLALDKTRESHWQKADILIVSDGRFKVTEDLLYKKQNLNPKTRVFGLQVSHWNSSAFGDICHQTFTFNHV